MVVLRPPFGPRRVRRALQSLKFYALLQGGRGQATPAVECFCEAAARLSVMAVTLADCLAEVDVNPIRLTSNDCIGLDALVVPTATMAGDSD